MHKPKKTKTSVVGLIVGGIVFVFFGLSQMVRPISYYSVGGTGRSAIADTTTVIEGNHARFTGLLLLFAGSFLLAVAYRIKKPHVSKSIKKNTEESAENRISDTTGTPWEDDKDHISR